MERSCDHFKIGETLFTRPIGPRLYLHAFREARQIHPTNSTEECIVKKAYDLISDNPRARFLVIGPCYHCQARVIVEVSQTKKSSSVEFFRQKNEGLHTAS